jgi:hypothetical protein
VTNVIGSNNVDIGMGVYPVGHIPSEVTYYIDPTLGDDANSGTSEAAPKRSLNAILLPNAGDTILLKRGEVFEDPVNGMMLDIRESGLEGYPITYGAYGNAADPKPVIKRQTDLTGWDDPNNWARLNFSDANSFDFGGCSYSANYGPLNSRSFIRANYFSQDGTKFRLNVGANNYNPLEIESAFIGEQATSGDAYDMEPGTIAQITFGGGNNSITVYVGDVNQSDWIDYNFDHTKTYIISLGISEAPVGIYASDEDSELSYYKAGPGRDDDAGMADAPSDYIALSGYWDIAGYAIDNPGVQGNIWQTDFSRDPERVWMDDIENCMYIQKEAILPLLIPVWK